MKEESTSWGRWAEERETWRQVFTRGEEMGWVIRVPNPQGKKGKIGDMEQNVKKERKFILAYKFTIKMRSCRMRSYRTLL